MNLISQIDYSQKLLKVEILKLLFKEKIVPEEMAKIF